MKIKVTDSTNKIMPISMGDVIKEQRESYVVKTTCNCELVINKDYLKQQITNKQGIKHNHFDKGVEVDKNTK